MRIQTRRQILFAREFARAKRRNKYENTYYVRAQWENAEKVGNKNGRTKGKALAGLFSQLKSPLQLIT